MVSKVSKPARVCRHPPRSQTNNRKPTNIPVKKPCDIHIHVSAPAGCGTPEPPRPAHDSCSTTYLIGGANLIALCVALARGARAIENEIGREGDEPGARLCAHLRGKDDIVDNAAPNVVAALPVGPAVFGHGAVYNSCGCGENISDGGVVAAVHLDPAHVGITALLRKRLCAVVRRDNLAEEGRRRAGGLDNLPTELAAAADDDHSAASAGGHGDAIQQLAYLVPSETRV
jgi:hypothetical protein